MPKISVDLTAEELARVNAYAKAKGVSTRALAHDLLVAEADKARFVETARKYRELALLAVKDAPAGLR